jgi:hypothetical protein
MKPVITIHIFVEVTKTDQRKIEFNKEQVTGRQIKEAAKVSLEDDLMAKVGGREEVVKNDDTVTIKNGEHFYVSPKTHVINFTVNDEPYSTTEKELTPIKIMQMAGIDPDQNYLVEIINKKQESYKDEPNKIIHIHDGMEFIANFMGPKPVSDRRFHYGQR